MSLANSIGTGVADVQGHVIISSRASSKYYLDQEPLLPNVPTYLASEDSDKKYIAREPR